MYDKDYYLAHREEILTRTRKWREAHPEKYRRALKRCIKRNGLKYKVQQKNYRCANWNKIEEKNKTYYATHHERVLSRAKQYRKENAKKLRRKRNEYKRRIRYQNISGWVIDYEIQNGRFRWVGRKGKYKISDEKEQGFPTMRSAYLNAKRMLG